MKGNKPLLIVALVAVVNALGYGIIIPVLYSYSIRYGLSDFENGLLFATFSLCQFISTPVIGRLSDKYGRKPLLSISLFGTFLSFILMAFAPSSIFLFIARALDGITAGNIPVASAVISDTTDIKNRAKGFGIIGASFGFGFVIGPAISGLSLRYGIHTPFLIAAAISFVSLLLTLIFLPETNRFEKEIEKKKMFDFKRLIYSIVDKEIGSVLFVSLLYSLSFSLFIYAYQPFSVKVLMMDPSTIALNFTLIGIVGVISQIFFIPKVTKILGDKKSLVYSVLLASIVFFLLFFTQETTLFIIITLFNALFNSFVGPLIQTLLSKDVDPKSQGSILGLNASYISLGQIIGPFIGGLLATISLNIPFLTAAIFVFICFLVAKYVFPKRTTVKHAF